jgi:hypothetical protein
MPRTPKEQFGELEASELFCGRCRTSRPLRKRLLLVLPTGTLYEYRCAVCGESVGGKQDNDPSEFAAIYRRT